MEFLSSLYMLTLVTIIKTLPGKCWVSRFIGCKVAVLAGDVLIRKDVWEPSDRTLCGFQGLMEHLQFKVIHLLSIYRLSIYFLVQLENIGAMANDLSLNYSEWSFQ